MKFTKKERRFWKTFYGTKNPADIPSHVDHMNLKLEDIHDVNLKWITQRIKSINKLSLDDTYITDEGVAHLVQLEDLKELRLKNLPKITDACIPALQKMGSLELLHLGGTSLTMEGILQLKILTKLKKLLFSAETKNHREELNELASALPECDLIANHKVYRKGS